MAAGLLLRVHEIAVDDDLEDAAARRDEAQIRDFVLEVGEQAFRQTDGSRRVASLRTVFDRDLHGAAVYRPERPVSIS